MRLLRFILSAASQKPPDMAVTELRVEVEKDELTVLDGYVMATGTSKAEVIRKLLKQWSDSKMHEAIVICRMTRVNPTDPEPSRIQESV